MVAELPNPALILLLKSATQDPDICRVSVLQTLWSGYGQCLRYYSLQNQEYRVAKIISPPQAAEHPKGWASETAHNRKLESYRVETAFYTRIQSQLNAPAFSAKLLFQYQSRDTSLLVLEDLKYSGFSVTPTTLSAQQCQPVLQWLAQFHGQFIGIDTPGTWSRGTYWHLGTRQKEFEAMPGGPLKSSASKLEKALFCSPYQTLLHGDAKVANFCFTPDFSQAAAVDFQYTGKGIGVQDLVYFLGSALEESEQKVHFDELVDNYFEYLWRVIANKSGHQKANEVTADWRVRTDIACADFHRFLAGWSPGHWKINALLKSQTQRALKILAD
ncbi:DUF1679 domain-containing protein [Alteromonas aestuariivivens]|uniref:DUF1679 domain-containing protein n=1 Tax=Alteromonas aestuariivivens TaxID=1938339 RepID=A0A3D8MB12_9ALTE|nr:oxidoreductase family protein [Alteromonas aestuariivivens]RDV27438.1 DUF1679 domain-containing protein [Alteromonas aestuariivivens]